ncbi:Phage integrase family protein [Marinomonas polaris DSM 16579]|jgi:integrase|uniref:Phage integrase family protein n=1 Tax=Marinomonas polaris DSM 16579 TaxID=1122206 RepID=A0A1M5KI60_9GAMM|nr:site-specific integrase [Marinomonas polaris]SHG52408.1 Phage integrase family protein [Marinomonas polaris DSM 16579]
MALPIINYVSYFSDFDNRSDIESLKIRWFKDCSYDSDIWVLQDTKNMKRTYDIDWENIPVGPNGEKLNNYYGAVQLIKMSLLIRASTTDKKLGMTDSAESLCKAANILFNFYRYLLLIPKISNLSSINSSVIDQLITDYSTKGLIARLDLDSRAVNRFDEIISNGNIGTYTKIGKSTRYLKTNYERIEFDNDMFSFELGISARALQNAPKYQLLKYKTLKPLGYVLKGSGVVKNDIEAQSESTIRKSLSVISSLMRQVYLMSDLFTENHRVERMWMGDIKLSKLSKKKATVSNAKTRNIPRNVMYAVMDESIRWVIDYSTPLQNNFKYAKQVYKEKLEAIKDYGLGGNDESKTNYARKLTAVWIRENKLTNFPHPITTYRHQITSLEQIVNKHLVSACLLVIFAFTARRRDEVYGLKSGCTYQEGGLWYLIVDQEKFNQGERALPTLEVVAKAISILEDLSAEGRDASQFNNLMQVTDANSKHGRAWPDFNGFCDYVGIESKDEEGNPFIFSDHQFRRFLAMAYYYQYRDPNLFTLNWFLGHESIEMTMDYITDSDGQWEMQQVKNERIIDLIESDFRSDKSLIGNEIAELFGVIEGQSEKRISRMEDKGKLVDKYVLNFVKDGACFGLTPDIKKRSKCLENGAIQCSSATKGSCEGCPNLLPVDQPINHINVTDLVCSSSPMLEALQNG